MRLIYSISIHCYHIFILIASFFNAKAKKWVIGRKNIFQELENKIEHLKSEDEKHKLIWLHCASLGEFEQGRPLIEKLKENNSEVKILLTFFSPSGYEIRKNYIHADWVFYLPIDTIKNAKRFIATIKPDMAIFVKYEFWYNYLNQLKINNIPTYLVSAIFRENQPFFKPYGSWFTKQLRAFSCFFVQDENSKKLLKQIGFTDVVISGDTRFDRVYEVSKNAKQFEIIKAFCGDNKILIAGSAWNEDLEIISKWFNSQQQSLNYKLIIAPHNIDQGTIQSTIQKFKNSKIIKYSETNSENVKVANVLIIDNVGMLSSLYQYGTIAFIGGGFGKGIHNILEAATFGLPVIFGPNYQKFEEAKRLINLGGAFSISKATELKKIMNSLSVEKELNRSSKIAKDYVISNIGATQTIFDFIKY